MKLFLILRSILINIMIYCSDQYSVARIYRKYFGVKIGHNVRFTGKKISFGSEPYLVEIGNDVTITSGVKFETHDGGAGVFRKEYPGINIFGQIIIGNNVFIGHDVKIMPHVKIGNNVVIGAGSIVTKDIPNNVVAVGIPARVIKSMEEYKDKVLKNAIFVKEKNFRKRKKIIQEKLKKL